MLGAVLISGSGKKERVNKAWELLVNRGFQIETVSPDLLIIQKVSEKKSVGIAQAREIKDFMRERPFEGKVKAVLVEDAHLLTDEAQGSLLKVLEEPPAFALIILLTDKEGSLLPTVVSRCQKIVIRAGNAAKRISEYNIAGMSYEEIFDLAKEVSARGKDEAIEFLEHVLRHDLTSQPLNVIQEMEKAVKELKEANVALKFALEYLFLLHKLRV